MSDDQIRDLLVLIHTELSSDSSYDLSLSEILEANVEDRITYLFELVKFLLKVKANFEGLQDIESFNTHDQYQKALQKLESEVRGHITIEQQMKLALENTQSRMEESEQSVNKLTAIITDLHQENKELKDKKDNFKVVYELNKLRNNAKKDAQKISESQKYIAKLETDLSRYASAYTELLKEFETVNSKYMKIKHTLISNENSYRRDFNSTCPRKSYSPELSKTDRSIFASHNQRLGYSRRF